ncbi:MAG: PhnD/SsuA/transferrin family substrate-binding protein, partial [Proteobacteria bacterium]|nr:PhnD/SsuA/transferrin family substrate-binding protein [Pseudomonadota bacterium]
MIFTKANRADIKDLDHIRGKSIMGVHKEAFGGCRMALRRLKDMGIVPYDDCSKVLFPPEGTQESVVRSVIRGVADVGTVRTGIIEGLIRKGEMAAGDV